MDEDEDEASLFSDLMPKKKKPTDDIFKNRESEGFIEILIKRHLINNHNKFREYFRINYEQFNFLLTLVEEKLTLQPSNRIKKPITPAEKLAVTLRYLATGESIRLLSFAFRISHNYLSTIIKNTLAELKIKLLPIFLSDSKNIDYKQKSAEFSYKWNFTNCILAIDGKHVRIRSPNKSGTLYYNYKDFFSIVLLAMVDENYKFVAVDIGSFEEMKPISTCEKPSFRTLIIGLTSDNFVPDRRAISNQLLNKYKTYVTDLTNVISEKMYKCIPTDIWSSLNKSYLGMTLHYIEEKSHNQFSYVLACQRIEGSHNYSNIAKCISKVMNSYKINVTKITHTVTDNASNFGKAFRVYVQQFASPKTVSTNNVTLDAQNINILMDVLDHDDLDIILSNHLTCSAHTLNLVTTIDTSKITNSQYKMLSRSAFECNEVSSIMNTESRPSTTDNDSGDEFYTPISNSQLNKFSTHYLLSYLDNFKVICAQHCPYRYNGHLTQKQKNFNFCHSSARMAIERSFGFLKGRFRSLLTTLDMKRVDIIPKYIIACCVLHNICSLKDDEFPDLHETPPVDDNLQARGELVAINRQGAIKRDNICDQPPLRHI
ncbi:hypothetical protein QTP88_001757 [Uroleucon formosanum]